jgi:hypothetical protein
MAFNSRLGLRRFAPFSLPPRAITKKSKAALLAQMPFFCSPSSLTKASFRRFAGKQKKRNLNGCAFDFFVIRLERARLKWAKTI